MSLYGADFLRSANRLLYVHGKSNPDVQVSYSINVQVSDRMFRFPTQ
jgi:hypothetical protein